MGKQVRRLGEGVTDLEKELAAIEARANAAFGERWHYNGFLNTVLLLDAKGEVRDRVVTVDGLYELPHTSKLQAAAGKFIAHARTDVPRLLAALRVAMVCVTAFDHDEGTGGAYGAEVLAALKGEK